MSTFDATGLTIDRYDDVFASLEASFKGVFGDDIDTSPESVFGQLIAIIAERVSDQNEVIEGVASAFDPAKAVGVWLSQLALLNGITRNAAEYSQVSVRCTANAAGTTIIAGDLVSSSTTKEKFACDATTVIPPSTNALVSFTAVNPGAISAAIGTIDTIETPRYGWASAVNLTAAVEGRSVETDAALRLRRQRVAERSGAGGGGAIYAAIADIDGVEAVTVFVNNTTGTVNSVPRQHVWAVVLGGADDDIAAAIFPFTAAGIGTYGAVTVAYTDPITGQTYDVNFSRPVNITVYIDVTLDRAVGYPVNGDELIEDALLEYFTDNFSVGDDIEYSRLYTPINSVPGHTVSSLKIGTTAPPSGTSNIVIADNQIGVLTAARINVL